MVCDQRVDILSVYEVLFNFLVAKTSDLPFLSAMLYHVLGLVVVVCTVSGQSITITGPSTVTTPTSELRITCTPSTVGIADINSITIRKNSSTLGYQNVVSVTYSQATSDSVLTWGNVISNTRAGVSATGNVNTVSGASLVLIIAANRTICTDGGAYQCNMGVTLTGGSGGVADAEKYVAATEIPTSTNNPLTVFPFPNVDSTYYSVGTTLTITCSGTVGSDRKYHTWCYKRANDFGYTGYPTGADINQNDDNLVQSGCNYIRTSTLTYTVTEADSNTTFLCEPFTGSLCGSNPASLIGYLSIQIYSGDGVTIWIIIAVVFILATVSLSIIVGFMYHRIREYKEQLHQRMNYEITNRYPRRDEHVYSTTDNYDNINS
ncbi:uncharacterized protein [Argopecten irradians]|uniref:uncharacterized protein isoform X2 n=1 Tax=Argopecten irradians TaxID=31199 RepID=UPI0037195D42